MIDFLENVALLVALMVAGAGVATTVAIMVLKFIDTMENRDG